MLFALLSGPARGTLTISWYCPIAPSWEGIAMHRPSPAEDSGPEDFARWLAGARAGNRKALGRLLDLCGSYLLQIAQMELPDRLHGKVDPANLVQDTFLEAQTGFGGFHGDTEPALLAWLRGILRHN